MHDERLYQMISVARPHGSKSEREWVARFLSPYNPIDLDDLAYVIQVRDGNDRITPVLFSCHVDTVHRKEGPHVVRYDAKTGYYFKDDDEPLGADDTAGCWLMLEMIDARVPGTYVFHRGEERGGIGSSGMAKSDKHSKWLASFNYAIAFDRKGTDSVITHQGFTRCASDAFAQALADQLNMHDPEFMYSPDDTGVFTDTANYTDLIPECTNLSCGYYSEHTGKETLDLRHLFAMRDVLVKVEWTSLPVERDPSEVEYADMPRWTSEFLLDDRPVRTVRDHGLNLYNMTRTEMVQMAETDPDEFVDMVMDELWGGSQYDDDDYDDYQPKLKVGLM